MVISVVSLPVQILCKIDNFLSCLTCQALRCKTQDKYHRVHLLCTHLSFHVEIILTLLTKEFMRGVSVVTRLVGTVAEALSMRPHVQKSRGNCPLRRYRSAPKCTCIKCSLPGMSPCALSRLGASGCNDSYAVYASYAVLHLRLSAYAQIN